MGFSGAPIYRHINRSHPWRIEQSFDKVWKLIHVSNTASQTETGRIQKSAQRWFAANIIFLCFTISFFHLLKLVHLVANSLRPYPPISGWMLPTFSSPECKILSPLIGDIYWLESSVPISIYWQTVNPTMTPHKVTVTILKQNRQSLVRSALN